MKKLVLFDIDGTLIRSLLQVRAFERFTYAIKKVYGIDIHTDLALTGGRYNGTGDRWIILDLMKESVLSKQEIIEGLPEIANEFCSYLDKMAMHQQVYEVIHDARMLVDTVVSSPHHIASVLTGNLEKSAQWKLKHAGYKLFYDFGIFGQEADQRQDLAALVFSKSKNHLGFEIPPQNIVIIGDTVHDVRCGKAIGAMTIAVSSGLNVDKKSLEQEKPDLLVDSLMDKRVLELLGLE